MEHIIHLQDNNLLHIIDINYFQSHYTQSNHDDIEYITSLWYQRNIHHHSYQRKHSF